MRQQLFGLRPGESATMNRRARLVGHASRSRARFCSTVLRGLSGTIIYAILCGCTSQSGTAGGTNGAATASPDGGCGAISATGICENGVIFWCYKGTLLKLDCGKGGGSGCSINNGSWACTGASSPAPQTSPSTAMALKSCIDGCKGYCKTAPCGCVDQHGGNACALQCALDRLNCAVQCPCGCYAATPTGAQVDIADCSKGCLNVCAAESAKCTAKCSSYACSTQCSSGHNSCIVAALKVCR